MVWRKTVRLAWLAGCAAWLMQSAAPVSASVVIGATRVIYDAPEPEVTLRLSNVGQSPALVQSWIDNGQLYSAPSDISVPFTVTPPIARIDPSKSQTLRIIYTGEALPGDRESVFWLNVLEVPPKPATRDAESHRLQLAFRSRIKLFYRPEHLPGTANGAPSRLTWRLARVGGALVAEAHNPTAFHVSLTKLSVIEGDKTATFDDGAMIDPHGTHRFALHGDALDVAPGAPDLTVRYDTLNDFGGVAERSAPIRAGQASRGSGRDD
ncbi:fimbria/pilus periplasmic chaperone [Burkholderia plantarii]|uniref:fimbria/pilus periplasmic chaperone n=1 Tax=Burkholderia plantarii TaxID=41899 RepID=UPI00272D75FB|nr:fimbria/pilus periplasmic chaperone [Burkholderia plantarii]WLE63662.1 fimbria/pilus periplasmic chaperone [Burkholderia plantarii]